MGMTFGTANGRTLRRAAAMLAAGLVLAGCVAAPPAAPPYPPVPPVRPETLPKPPVSEAPLIWEPGHWDWSGTTYNWQAGAWVPRAGHGTMWQDGYWEKKGDTWSWLPGHWQ